MKSFLKWSFGFVAIAALLLCLACAVTTWWSKNTWEDYQTDLVQRRGQHLDLTYFIPQQVPDEKNFAMIPLFKPLFNYAIDPRTNELAYIPPGPLIKTVRIDIKETATAPPHPAGWITGHRKDLKAWQGYYRQILPDMPHPEPPAEDMLAVLARYDAMFNELKQAAATRPYSRFPLRYDDGISMRFPHCPVLQNLQTVLAYRAIAKLELGRPDDALSDVQLGFRLVDAIHNEPLAISQLVRLTMMNILIQPIWEGIVTHRWSDAQLAKLEEQLRQIDFPADFNFCIQGERAKSNWLFDKIRNDPAWYNDAFAMLNIKPSTRMNLMKPLYTSFWYKNQTFLNRLDETSMLVIFDTHAKVVDVHRAKTTRAFIKTLPFSYATFLTRILMSSFVDMPRHFAQAQSYADEALIACEIERYRIAHGALPATLADLQMKDLPHDIINEQPLHYRLAGNDNYVLYSIGWDEKDDGGKLVMKKEDAGGIDYDQGDWVWSLKPLTP